MKPTRLRAPKSPRGVTLIELMVVIVLLGILAAAAGPTVRRSIERAAAKGNAREVANALRMARNQAMSRGEVLLVRVFPKTDASRGRVEVYRAGNANTPASESGGETGSSTPDTDSESSAPVITDPARNCRQAITNAWDPALLVHTTTLDGKSGRSEIAAVASAASSGAVELCFSPDGRVLEKDRATPPLADEFMGCGENVVIVVADHGVTLGGLADCDPALTAAGRAELRDKRDALNLYRIVGSYNGNIRVVQ